jgi:hypothetical protein
MTLSEIICNALDNTYSMEQAAADLGELMMERELIRRKYDLTSPRLREIEQLIPIQEALAIGRLRQAGAFQQLAPLGIRVDKA